MLYSNITGNGTTAVKGSQGRLHAIIINNPGATWTATIYDNTAASGNKIGTLSPTAAGALQYGVDFGTGLTIVTAGTTPGDLTIAFM